MSDESLSCRRGFATCAVLYLWALSAVLGLSYAFGGETLFVIFILYVIACMYGTKLMIDGARARTSQDNVAEFSRSGAFVVYVDAWNSFHYLFRHDRDITQEVMTPLGDELRSQLGCTDLKETTFKDIDRDIPQPEIRAFRVTLAPDSMRRTRSHFVCTASRTQSVQGLRWWVVVLGVRDPNKVFWRYALAPLTLPFVVIAYTRREFEPLHGLMSVDPGFFNSVDALSRTREIEFVAFEALASTLESFGIDTTDLRAQRANILSINVSEVGRATFGSVVQGAFNKFSGGGGGGH